MQLLKSLVIGMGVVIVLGMALLAYSIARKADDPDWRPFQAAGPGSAPAAAAPAAATAPPAPAARSFGDLSLRLPEGCVIAAIRPDGGRLYVSVGPTPACNRVVVVDVERGRVLGTLKPGP